MQKKTANNDGQHGAAVGAAGPAPGGQPPSAAQQPPHGTEQRPSGPVCNCTVCVAARTAFRLIDWAAAWHSQAGRSGGEHQHSSGGQRSQPGAEAADWYSITRAEAVRLRYLLGAGEWDEDLPNDGVYVGRAWGWPEPAASYRERMRTAGAAELAVVVAAAQAEDERRRRVLMQLVHNIRYGADAHVPALSPRWLRWTQVPLLRLVVRRGLVGAAVACAVAAFALAIGATVSDAALAGACCCIAVLVAMYVG